MKILLIIILLFPFIAQGSVIINEVAWMGSEISYSDEWIELKNMTNQDIDLSGWVIENASKNHASLEIPQDGKHIIPSNGYYLISYYSMADNLSEPKTIINIITDWRVKGMGDISLANNYKDNGELKLRDNQGKLIDQTPSSDDDNWSAGDNKTKHTMERTPSGNWQNSQDPNGTPKTKNSVSIAPESPLSPPEEPSAQSIPQAPSKPELPQRSNSESIIYLSGILINEVLPSPQGPDQENEYIELMNTNNEEVNLSNWKIQDITGSTKTYVFPENTKIKANGYLIIMRPTSKITLNNDGDGLELKNPAEEIVDSVNFGKASLNQSYSRTSSDWAWTISLTPNSKNVIAKSNEQRTKNNEQNLSRNELETGSIESSSKQVKLVDNIEKPFKISVFLIAFITAILSGIAFLMIKSNLKGFWY